MAERPEPAPEIDADRAKPEPNVHWEEARGPLDALGCVSGCLGHGCSSSAIALAIIAVAAVVVALALG